MYANNILTKFKKHLKNSTSINLSQKHNANSNKASKLLPLVLVPALLLAGCDDDSETNMTNTAIIVESHPSYYEDIQPIRMQDNLAKMLGASNGYYEYHFIDAAKTAGHVCPAVAGAWMETVTGLNALYGEETPIRGRIHVTMKGSQDDGFTGVMANVIGLITGATKDQGFGGIYGKPENNRQNLLAFNNDTSQGPMYTIFTKLDANQAPLSCVKVMYNPGAVPAKEEINDYTPFIKDGTATEEQQAKFASLWQDRVKRMMIDNFQDSVNSEMIYTTECDINADLGDIFNN